MIGSRVGTSFPGNDYGLVRYTSTAIAHPGAVNLYNGTSRDITSAGTRSSASPSAAVAAPRVSFAAP